MDGSYHLSVKNSDVITESICERSFMSNSQKLRLSPRFFDTQFSLYQNWQAAFWRELIQNAVDGDGKSGASAIEITIEKHLNDVLVSFKDNGPGMDRDTLENTYFVLGETTKHSNGTIGGFGMARVLTCFAQKEYTILTRKNKVYGSGGDYEFAEMNETFHGCRLDIRVDRPGYESLQHELERYLRKCYLPCTVKINGVAWKEWSYRNRHARELTFGNIYTNKSATPEIIVRVNGAMMFRRPTNAPAQVILEINSNDSRKVLMASRDGLTHPYNEELEAFVTELNINKRSALTRRVDKSTVVEGTGTFVTNRKKQDESTKRLNTLDNTGTEVRNPAPVQRPVGNVPLPDNYLPYYNNDEPSINLFNVVIEDETDNSAVKRRIDLYNPVNWDLGPVPTRCNANGLYRQGMSFLKLLLIWQSACESAINGLQELVPEFPESVNWGVGWVFSDHALAQCKKSKNVNYLLLNPCDAEGNMKYNLSEKMDLCCIIANASHEAVHIIAGYHDEDYANYLTQLQSLMHYRQGDVLRRMKEAKMSYQTVFS